VVALCGAVSREDRLKRTHESMDAHTLTPHYDHSGNDIINIIQQAYLKAVTTTTGPTGCADLPTNKLSARAIGLGAPG
jgi:hypothetical protein